MFNGKDDWTAAPVGVRAWASQRAVELIAAHTPWFGFQGVDVDRLRQRPGWEDAKPHIVVSAQLLNRVHRRTSLRADGLLVIADDHHLRDDSRLTYRRMRAASVQGLSDGALDHLLDTMYFGPSNQSRLLQAVDVLTYFEQRRRHVTGREGRVGGGGHDARKAVGGGPVHARQHPRERAGPVGRRIGQDMALVDDDRAAAYGRHFLEDMGGDHDCLVMRHILDQFAHFMLRFAAE